MSDNEAVYFSKDFTLQEPLSDEAIDCAIKILKSGKLHRYNVSPDEVSETALFEDEFAKYIGKKYCLSCASCGSAMFIALKSCGVKSGDKVLCNAFTLAPVPGAIEKTGAIVELVEILPDYTIDLKDLENKAVGAKYLLLSHMRGHITNMDQIMDICNKYGVILIEDAAHTMGATWDGKKSGSFGKVGCFSTQTYKHINSGEGGLLVTDDPDVLARAICYSGSYMNFQYHTSRPEDSYFDNVKFIIPNYSTRMDNLRASILRPQLRNLDKKIQRWLSLYNIIKHGLSQSSLFTIPERDSREYFVGSSIQFSLLNQPQEKIRNFINEGSLAGVKIAWFGDHNPVGFTSTYSNWEYLQKMPFLSKTNEVLSTLCDIRIAPTFDEDDCRLLVAILIKIADRVFS